MKKAFNVRTINDYTRSQWNIKAAEKQGNEVNNRVIFCQSHAPKFLKSLIHTASLAADQAVLPLEYIWSDGAHASWVYVYNDPQNIILHYLYCPCASSHHSEQTKTTTKDLFLLSRFSN